MHCQSATSLINGKCRLVRHLGGLSGGGVGGEGGGEAIGLGGGGEAIGLGGGA